MSPIPAGLASLLGAAGGARTTGAAAPVHDASALDFARLLEQARGAQLDSGRPVTAATGLDLDLSDDQMTRLAAAADRAEAAGAITAVVLLDGEALVMDVTARSITGRLDLAAGEPLTGIDTVVSAPADAQPALAAPPAALHTHPSLLEALKRSA